MEVAFGLFDRLGGSRALAVAGLRRVGHRFEVAAQRAGVREWDQAFAGAPAGHQQGGGQAQRRGYREADQHSHPH